jgi:hypothetical protein
MLKPGLERASRAEAQVDFADSFQALQERNG